MMILDSGWSTDSLWGCGLIGLLLLIVVVLLVDRPWRCWTGLGDRAADTVGSDGRTQTTIKDLHGRRTSDEMDMTEFDVLWGSPA